MEHAPARIWRFGDRTVSRIGFGAMQFTGPRAFGPIKDRAQAIAVVHEAVALGVDHLDTSDFYGPHCVNELLRDALRGAPVAPMVVTKIGAFRDEDGSWIEASDPAGVVQAVEANRRHLGMDVLDVVNLRVTIGAHRPAENDIERAFAALAVEWEKGHIRHLGLSNATSQQVAQARRIAPVICVQNSYSLANRDDDPLIDELARKGIAYVPYFPLGGMDATQRAALGEIAQASSATPAQVALAWLLRRSDNILPIPGTSSIDHLRENIAAANLRLAPESLQRLATIFHPPTTERSRS